MRRLLACFALAGLAGPVAACINDGELPTHEREFRSQYLRTVDVPPAPPTATDVPSHLLLLGAGAALLVGAVVLTPAGGRPRK
jgi:hypothetical protein